MVVEDERDIQDIVAYNLQQAGYEVVLASRGDDAVRIAKQQKPDLVLLDLMLPGLSGKEVCQAIRRDPSTANTPVIMLTAKGEEVDRVVGLEVGADDYVTKPFSMRELMLRVQTILRRAGGKPTTSGEANIEFGCLRVDVAAHRAWVEGREVELTALEFKLLVTLHERKNRVQRRETLLNDVWGISADVTTRTVDTHVKRLREKLGAAGTFVETVRGVGYRFSETPSESSDL
jgi:two-component system, OmpR family, phosphate regulon response regulator PhoB